MPEETVPELPHGYEGVEEAQAVIAVSGRDSCVLDQDHPVLFPEFEGACREPFGVKLVSKDESDFVQVQINYHECLNFETTPD